MEQFSEEQVRNNYYFSVVPISGTQSKDSWGVRVVVLKDREEVMVLMKKKWVVIIH